MKILSALAYTLPTDLGLVISIWSDDFGCEAMRGFPYGLPRAEQETRAVDLRITPMLESSDKLSDIVALTPDGQAFVDLMAELAPRPARAVCQRCGADGAGHLGMCDACDEHMH